ncbi:hypothetical protein E6R18_32810 [Streptomyces sp. A1277]|uniref:hypothetical protein n=1 Tax=Streptomyces sp. A1277 TaxID=2563103 RepID=UPI0010A25242|nr:hypothetical protein [Streptomyces sp. A1277]THA22729.1 hypothetical protein E6R18_32810 [Streptomyces sp. A1277]
MPPSAEPTHPREPSGPPGTVIPISRRRGHRSLTPSPGRRSAGQPPAPSPEQLLAETIEALFLQHGHTLSDDDTADIYRTTLDALQLLLDGSQATGKLGGEEHQYLTGMVAGMRGAPDDL